MNKKAISKRKSWRNQLDSKLHLSVTHINQLIKDYVNTVSLNLEIQSVVVVVWITLWGCKYLDTGSLNSKCCLNRCVLRRCKVLFEQAWVYWPNTQLSDVMPLIILKPQMSVTFHSSPNRQFCWCSILQVISKRKKKVLNKQISYKNQHTGISSYYHDKV